MHKIIISLIVIHIVFLGLIVSDFYKNRNDIQQKSDHNIEVLRKLIIGQLVILSINVLTLIMGRKWWIITTLIISTVYSTSLFIYAMTQNKKFVDYKLTMWSNLTYSMMFYFFGFIYMVVKSPIYGSSV